MASGLLVLSWGLKDFGAALCRGKMDSVRDCRGSYLLFCALRQTELRLVAYRSEAGGPASGRDFGFTVRNVSPRMGVRLPLEDWNDKLEAQEGMRSRGADRHFACLGCPESATNWKFDRDVFGMAFA